MKLRSVEQAGDLRGKRVFLRADLDVPLIEDSGVWKVGDDNRIKFSFETINYLIENKAKIILAGHMDRPGGVPDPSKSTKSIAAYLQGKFSGVKFIGYCCGKPVADAIEALQPAHILVLENLRFLRDEEDNSEDFARSLSELADVYVNDDFSNSHRNHASMTRITKYLPSYAGFHLQKEVETLSKVLNNPRRPFYVVIGGAKVETKLPVIKNFLAVADKIFVGGKTGCFKENLGKLGSKVIFSCGDPDLSFNTAKDWAVDILNARTIVWNGPLGDVSSNQVLGTDLIAQAVVEATGNGAKSIVGGGDTEAYLRSSGLEKSVTLLSTGGGAMLDFLAGVKLPALEPLIEK